MRRLAGIPLNGLHAADAVHRLGSLSAAARDLGVSPGAVSQQIARLEDVLGRDLFERRPGGMRARPEFAEVFDRLSRGFEHLDAAVDLTRRDRQTSLTISVASIFATRWLIWRLPEFSRRHPEIRVRLDSEIALIDPNTGAADFTIRIGAGPYPGVTVERLVPQRITPVCHADVAKRLNRIDDLRRVPVIRDMNAPFDWDNWLPEGGLRNADLPPGPEFSDGSLCMDSAMTGAGVYLAFETVCIDALKRGQITAPFPRWAETDASYWLISARDRSLTTAQRRFRDWLKEAISAEGLGVADVPGGSAG